MPVDSFCQYIHLFGDIPTDDMAAWKAGWFDRPERQAQKDLQKYWINHPPHWEWIKETDVEKRMQMVRQAVEAGIGPGGGIISDKSSLWGSTLIAASDSANGGLSAIKSECSAAVTTVATGQESPATGDGYFITLHNRDAGTVANEVAASCGASCRFPISGLALSPPQQRYQFEGHNPMAEVGVAWRSTLSRPASPVRAAHWRLSKDLVLSSVQGGYSQQTHPARAVMEILKSGAKMSMLAVDIGAAGGNPEIGPLFKGDAVTEGRRWGGIQVDPRVQFLEKFSKVKNVESTAEPPTIAGILWDNCMPHDIDILKLDIDCYGEEKSVVQTPPVCQPCTSFSFWSGHALISHRMWLMHALQTTRLPRRF